MPTEPLTESALSGLTQLVARDRGIEVLGGLEHCVNLESLNLAYNNIAEIGPLAALGKLSELWLHYNAVEDVSALQNLTQLRNLQLGYNNHISDISPLAHLTALQSLVLGQNQITDISPLANLTQLELLRLHQNNVSDLSHLSQLTGLTHLHVGFNQITDLSPVAALKNLEILAFPANQVNDISVVASLSNLTHLNMHHNQVSDISAVAGLDNLEEVLFRFNAIGNISALNSLTDLESVDLRHNQVANVDALVGNPGIGDGDTVDVRENPLSCEAANVQLPALESRGVTVLYDAVDGCVAWNLLAEWGMNEGEGLTVSDLTGNGYDGDVIRDGGSPAWGEGFLRFEGADYPQGQVEIDAIPSLGEFDDFAIEARFRLTGDTGWHQDLASVWGPSLIPDDDAWVLGFGAWNGKLHPRFWVENHGPLEDDQSDDLTVQAIGPGMALDDLNEWHTLRGVFLGGESVNLYLDGVLIASESVTWDRVAQTAGPMTIGNMHWFGDDWHSLHGDIDYVRVETGTVGGDIRGTVWHDLNADGMRDPGEPALTGWTVFWTRTATRRWMTVRYREPAALTGRTRSQFSAPGSYTVAVVVPPGWRQTFPSGSGDWTVSLGPGETLGNISFACKAVAPVPATSLDTLVEGVTKIASESGVPGPLVLEDSGGWIPIAFGDEDSYYDFQGEHRQPPILAAAASSARDVCWPWVSHS